MTPAKSSRKREEDTRSALEARGLNPDDEKSSGICPKCGDGWWAHKSGQCTAPKCECKEQPKGTK